MDQACVEPLTRIQLLGLAGLVLPLTEVGPRRHDSLVDEAGSRRRQALDRGGGGIAELATVAIGDGGVADVVVSRRQISRGTLEKERRHAEGILQNLTRGADEVGRQQPVLPGEGRRVARVVEQSRPRFARVAGDPRNEHRVVRGRVRVVAAGEPLSDGIPEVAVRRQSAAALPEGDPRRLERGDRLGDSVSDLLSQVVEVGLDQLGARLVAKL